MLVALLALTIVAVALLLPTIIRAARQVRDDRRHRRRSRRRERLELRDPGRERRAEQRARELLRSCVNAQEWAMYRDLGFIRVEGHGALHEARGTWPLGVAQAARRAADRHRDERRAGEAPYAYLIYPHKPIVAYVPATRRLLSEYCVEFPDLSEAIAGGRRLPDSDDVLAKWMALTGDEERLLRSANMHLPGRQVDPSRVRRDLWRLAEWERRRRSTHAPRA